MYSPSATTLKAPTRITSVSTRSPVSLLTVAEKRDTLPDSVISRCSSNQSCSISSMVASCDAVPIFAASSPSHSPRPGNSKLMMDVSKRPRVSPATCCSTPNSSRSEPRRLSNCSCMSPMRISFSSKRVSSRSLRCSSRRRSAFALSSSCCWSARRCTNSRSRRTWSRLSTTRRSSTFFKSSPKVSALTTSRSSAPAAGAASSSCAVALKASTAARHHVAVPERDFVIFTRFMMRYSGAVMGRMSMFGASCLRAMRMPLRTGVANSSLIGLQRRSC